jgi:hypothetical protein
MSGLLRPLPGPLYPRERDTVPTEYEARWALGPVWTNAENLAPTAIRYPAVQPVASRHTDYVIPAPQIHLDIDTRNDFLADKYRVMQTRPSNFTKHNTQ